MSGPSLERPAEFAEREFFTPEEADAFEQTALDRLLEPLSPADRTAADLNYIYLEYFRVLDDRRTSLVVDPTNGRLPELVAQAKERAAARRPPSSDHPETRTLDDRCLVSLPRGKQILSLQSCIPTTYTRTTSPSTSAVAVWAGLRESLI